MELLKAIAIIPKPAEQGALGVGMAAPGTGAGRGGPIVRGRGRGRGGVARGGAAGGGVGRGKRPVATAAIAPKPGAAAPAVAAPAPAAPAAPAPAPATVAPAVTSGVKGTGGALPGDVGGPGTYALREGVDYQLGVTKLFIKEPRNLFALEVRAAEEEGGEGASPIVLSLSQTILHCPPHYPPHPAVHALAGAGQGGLAHRGAVARACGQARVRAHPFRVGAHAGAGAAPLRA